MSLPDSWVDRIFSRLAVRYGAAWLRMWEGIPIDAVKADWALELHTMSGESIGYALEHLPPDRPPNVVQFKALCLSRPPSGVPALPAPRGPIPHEVAEKLKEIGKAHRDCPPRAWARHLRDREAAGEKLSTAQRAMWREALQ